MGKLAIVSGATESVTVSVNDYTGSGSIAAGKRAISAMNVGSADVTIQGLTYTPGSGVTWDLVPGVTYNSALTFDATGSVIRIEVME